MSLVPPGMGYSLVDHACRHCGGRIVQGGDTFRCSTCGATTCGRPDEVCGCGILPKLNSPTRFRCGPNPRKCEEFPSEIVILFGDQPATRRAA